MKGLKKGPELKMPDLKVPDFLKDLFYDLKDRRLLAPLGLVIVAIAAIPFILGGGSTDSDPAPATGAATLTGEPEAAASARFTVVEAKPGLRDYRKRLAARKATNPFKQRYTSVKVEGAELGQGDESSSTAGTVTTSSSSASETTTVSSSPSSTPPSSSPSPKGGDGKPHLTFFTWGIDVRIYKTVGDGSNTQEPTDQSEVLPQTPIPGQKAPVVTYMGPSRKAAEKRSEKVLLLVSPDVKEISGARTCVSGPPTDVCEMLEVELDSPLTFVYGAGETRYRINVLKIAPVVTGHS